MVTKTMVGQLETIFQHVSLPAIPTKNPKNFPAKTLNLATGIFIFLQFKNRNYR
jgi:hypothetical protein